MKDKNSLLTVDDTLAIKINAKGDTIGDCVDIKCQRYVLESLNTPKYQKMMREPQSNSSLCDQLAKAKYPKRVDIDEYQKVAPEIFATVTQEALEGALIGKDESLLKSIIQYSGQVKQARLNSVTAGDVRVYLSEKFYRAREKSYRGLLWRAY